jgi:hypothetical protein
MWNLAVFSFRFTPQTGSLGICPRSFNCLLFVFKIVVLVGLVVFLLTDGFI